VPIAVKEVFDVENLTATYGSQARVGAVAAADSEVVTRLRRAGALLMIKSGQWAVRAHLRKPKLQCPRRRGPAAQQHVPVLPVLGER
jgi:hypothetical protein